MTSCIAIIMVFNTGFVVHAQCFFTMKDVKSTTAFVQALNESMESGSLMCQLYSAELSKLLMNMTNSFCREQLRQEIPKVQYIKKAAFCLRKQPDSDIWVLNDKIQLTGSGIKVAQEESQFIWLESETGNCLQQVMPPLFQRR